MESILTWNFNTTVVIYRYHYLLASRLLLPYSSFLLPYIARYFCFPKLHLLIPLSMLHTEQSREIEIPNKHKHRCEALTVSVPGPHPKHVPFGGRTCNNKAFFLFRSRSQQYQCAWSLPKDTCASQRDSTASRHCDVVNAKRCTTTTNILRPRVPEATTI